MSNEDEIKELELLKNNVTQFSDIWIIKMCDKEIHRLRNQRQEIEK